MLRLRLNWRKRKELGGKGPVVLIAWLIALVLSMLSIAIHYEVMLGVSRWVPRLTQNKRLGTIIALYFLLMAHVVEIWLFAGGHYAAVEWLALGEFEGAFSSSIRDYSYFSAITYSSVGYGDIVPTGEVRTIAAVEGLLGLLLVAWSAAFTVFYLQRYWAGEETEGRKA